VALFSNKFWFNTENNQTHNLSNCEKTRERTRKNTLGNISLLKIQVFFLYLVRKEKLPQENTSKTAYSERAHCYKYLYCFSNNAFHLSDELLTYRKPDYILLLFVVVVNSFCLFVFIKCASLYYIFQYFVLKFDWSSSVLSRISCL